jgi:hypothetical protein
MRVFRKSAAAVAALAICAALGSAGTKGTGASAPSVRSRAEFDRLARVYYTGRGTPMPHIMFVVDRANRDAVYYVNSKQFRFHKEFVNAAYLSLERGDAFYAANYSNPNRRFLLGTLAYQVPLARFTFEFYESDDVTADVVALAAKRLGETFYAPLVYKANTDEQAAAARGVPGLETIRSDEIFKNEIYVALNPGVAFGVLRRLDSIGPDTVVDRNEIVILKEPPVSITPVSGIVNTIPPSPLSHLNVLAKSWNVPNVYAKGAAETYAGLLGKYVRLEARADGFDIRLADAKELVDVQRRDIEHTTLVTPKADLAWDRLTSLDEQRARDASRFGAKSANLGEAMAARVPGATVPTGFGIPFSYYDRFVKETGIEPAIFDMLDEQRFNHDVVYRRQRLAALRDRVVATPMPDALGRAIVARAHEMFGDAGLFVRSSTNAEDLPYFSGAGLYTTVPNVKGDDALLTAVKTVWASIWNDGAYEARSAAGMSHLVYPAVLVQLGMNADAAGVMVSTNPFNALDRGAVYINAKRGLGIRVVDGHKVAEQILIHPATNRVRVLTRSADDTALTFDANGGVREVAVETGRAVLTDDLARRLAVVAKRLERHFRVGPLDIEWLTVGDKIYVVQARPFATARARG